ncbi:Sodium-coupled monocarboxylate transporter 2 [Holothuria leucospilota]|uniref:Sodium-coupled monocarboxylate transporter 2 n=1 Tax=Holothuria leucospilota TaxID=206669 RepID=A0A9Q1H8M9_HOLLE|nr:Sodium-coupled monocarboxylate transporter 2 [Holothuria leucospilota]
MLSGFLVTAIACCVQVGGLGEVFKINARDGRDTVFDFRLDPRSQIAAGIGTFLMGSVELLAVITGVCIYAYYAGCDPLSLGKIRLADQIMVYIVVDLFHEIPGLAGFLISAVFSATLSTVSSGINAIAALIGYDVIKIHFPEIQGFKFTIVLKCVSILFGLVGIGMAFLVSVLGAILPLTLSIAGALMAPLFGVFCLGIFFPCCTSKGALVGMVCALGNGVWLMVGSFVYPPFIDDPPLFTDQCKLSNLATNFTDVMTSEWGAPMTTPFLSVTSLQPDETLPVITQYYSVSYAWYGLISSLITVSVGLVVSFLTGPNDPSTVDPNLLSPLPSIFCSWRKEKSLDKSLDNKSATRGNYFPIDKDIRDDKFESKF